MVKLQVPAQRQPEKLMLNEDNKEHLKVIVAAAQVSDMLQAAIQRLVAAESSADPRILSNNPRILSNSKELIKKYKRITTRLVQG